MTSSFRSSGRRIGPWLGARFRSLSIAAAACPFLIAPSADHDETLILQTASVERTVGLAPQVAIEAEPEPAGAPPGEIASQEEPPPVASSAEPVPIASHGVPSAAPTPDPEMDEVNQYLWSVYERTPTKRDGSGDFTWKDVAAAARLGMALGDYVIGGMDRDFRELLYRAGLVMDAAGIRWTILSAFRDDYRQGMAAGYKAHTGDSLHGGSATVGGYGHGCAIDIVDADLKSRALWTWLAANGAPLGLERPLAGLDPAHVQPRGPWHAVGAALRNERLGKDAPEAAAAEPAEPADPSTAAPTEADMMCIGLHHRRLFDPPPPTPEVASFKTAAAQAQSLGKMPKGGGKRTGGSRLAAQRGKAAARSVARHAPHTVPHTAGVT
jgi:hypothetical protein